MKKDLIFPASAIILLLLFATFQVNAQFNRFGGGLVFNSPMDIITDAASDDRDFEVGNPGFQLRGVYEIEKKFFIIPSLTFQIPKSKTFTDGSKRTTIFGSFDIDATYAIATEKQLLFYALLGGNVTNIYNSWKTDDPGLENNYRAAPGVAIGTGIEMIIENDINAYAQVKYVLSKYQQLVITLGVHYYFEGRRYRTW